eukprot:11161530-Karenia_brevis.AAC.1
MMLKRCSSRLSFLRPNVSFLQRMQAMHHQPSLLRLQLIFALLRVCTLKVLPAMQLQYSLMAPLMMVALLIVSSMLRM